MADRNNNGLYFIVGGIVVVVALLFFFMSGTDPGVATTDPVADGDTNITVDTVPDAADTPPVEVEDDVAPAVDAPAN